MSCHAYHAMYHPWDLYPYHYSHHPWPGWHHFGHFHSHPAWCPVCCQPAHLCCCMPRAPMSLPQELSAAPGATEQALIGGVHPVRLTLEYKPEAGATSPAVKVTVADAGGTSDWNLTSVPDGYHVKSDFSAVEPGATVTLETTECSARLRWCELICC